MRIIFERVCGTILKRNYKAVKVTAEDLEVVRSPWSLQENETNVCGSFGHMKRSGELWDFDGKNDKDLRSGWHPKVSRLLQHKASFQNRIESFKKFGSFGSFQIQSFKPYNKLQISSNLFKLNFLNLKVFVLTYKVNK
jgi:hypothetical protein